MNSERTQAYGRVLRTLEDVGPTKLHTPELARIREAADTLIFAAELDDAREALEDMEALCESLVATGAGARSAPPSWRATSSPAGRSRCAVARACARSRRSALRG